MSPFIRSIILIAFYCFIIPPTAGQSSNLLPPNQPEQDACHALAVCGGKFSVPYSYQGTGKIADLLATPCSPGIGEVNSMWLQLQVATAGSIVFSLIPADTTDDYDFAVLNVTNVPCNGLTAGNVVRCNFNNNISGSNSGGIIGLSTQGDTAFVQENIYGRSFCKYIDASAGETYLIMINNPGGSKGFTIDFTGSTAGFVQIPPPVFNGVADTASCGDASTILLQMSEPVLCSSIAVDGSDFVLQPYVPIASAEGINCLGTQGYTSQIFITLAEPLPKGQFTLNAKYSHDGGLIDLCGGEIQLPTNLAFTNNGSTNSFLVPSAFTPNGDGKNDYFGVKQWGAVTGLNLAVYNRLGMQVFYTRQPSQGWDGTYNGIQQPAGTYVYMITAHTICGTITRKGTVVLIR